MFSLSVFAQDDDSWWDEKTRGLYANTSFSIATFDGQYMNGMHASAGYKFNTWLAVGGGAGLERFEGQEMYDTLTANLSMVPVFAEIRYTPLNKRISPVVACKAGYKILTNIPTTEVYNWTFNIFPPLAWNDYYTYDTYDRGGFFINAEVGVKASVYKRINLYLAIDYSLWSVGGDHHYWIYEYREGKLTTKDFVGDTKAYTHSFALRLGFGF